MFQATLSVHGKSLGMSYMSTVSSLARQLKINGKIKRLPDGAVSVVCECHSDSDLEHFRKLISRNDSLVQVEKIEVQEKKEIEKPAFTWFYIDR